MSQHLRKVHSARNVNEYFMIDVWYENNSLFLQADTIAVTDCQKFYSEGLSSLHQENHSDQTYRNAKLSTRVFSTPNYSMTYRISKLHQKRDSTNVSSLLFFVYHSWSCRVGGKPVNSQHTNEKKE